MSRRAIEQLRALGAGAKAWAYENALIFFVLFIGLVAFVAIVVTTALNDAMGFSDKDFWDWMDLLIVPVVLALGAYFFSQSQKQAELAAAKSQKKLETELALDRQRHDTLQDYFDRMSELLFAVDLRKGLVGDPNPDVARTATLAVSIARARTLMALRSLDSGRVSAVFRFLSETMIENTQLKDIVSLVGADLRRIDWQGADLSYANLSGALLSQANLRGANLWWAELIEADLSDADLQGAELGMVDLRDAILRRANLQGAILWGAGLERAELEEALMARVELTDVLVLDPESTRVVFAPARVLAGQLLKAASLEGALMPDGVLLKGPDNPNGPTAQEWAERFRPRASWEPIDDDAPEA